MGALVAGSTNTAVVAPEDRKGRLPSVTANQYDGHPYSPYGFYCMNFDIQEIWIDEDAANEPLTHDVCRKLPGARVLSGSQAKQARHRLDLEADPLLRGKKILRLMKHRGAFVKPCPGTPEYVCCGLEIVHIGQGCPMECRYCALQVYFNRPVLEIFVNVDDLAQDVVRHLDASPDRFHRLCTGEFTDSLALDPLTCHARMLAELVSNRGNASLEIKTKTDLIDPLLGLEPTDRVIVSFSVNSPQIARSEEWRAAPLLRRIETAARAQGHGYRVGFHFDPIVPMPGWEAGYFDTVDRIANMTDTKRIAWISLGALRFVPSLKEVTRDRFGPIPYFHDGFLRGLDGKSRLPVERRVDVYRKMADRITRRAPDARVYLCMESPHVWQASLGLSMKSDRDLIAYLDEAAR
jgi:spore photoproduct lyase